MSKVFYVCSYGGSGSNMLCSALNKYGETKHIHSRNPPDSLEYIGKEKGGNTYMEWFNGIKIPENELHKYNVIFIYKNPIQAIYSRFKNLWHLKHIQSPNCTLEEVIEQNKDLYEIEDFYNNYTTFNKNRNYKIYCIKYEEIFDKQDDLSRLFNIGHLNLEKKESKRNYDSEEVDILKLIYENLMERQYNNNFIMVNNNQLVISNNIPIKNLSIKTHISNKKHFLKNLNFV